MGISARLNSLLRQRGLKVTELAQLSGVAPSSISRYLSDKQEPTLDALMKLASALGISLEELTGFTGAPGLSPRERFVTDLDQMKEKVLRPEGVDVREAFGGFSLPVLSAPSGVSGSSEVGRIFASADITDKEAYAIRVTDDLNIPRLERGDVAVFSPGASWKKGSLCVVLMKDGSFFVGRLGRRGHYLTLVTFGHPDDAKRVHERDVKAIHKLVWLKSR
jgi:transcriptional regulator with XRE-family HTH domain